MEATTAVPASTVAPIVAKVGEIKSELELELVEREVEIDLLLRCVIAKAHGLFVGEPGTAKSLSIDLFLTHVEGAVSFSKLLAKDTLNDEVLGPVSLKGLEQDEFRRILTDKLPEAHVAFMDEIFKSNSVVLNAALQIINERKYKNNGTTIDVPLWSMFGASNELPGAQDRDDLRAFRDRFGVTKIVEHVRTSDGLMRVIDGQLMRSRGETVANSHTTLTLDEIAQLQAASVAVDVPDNVKQAIVEMHSNAANENLKISVRRLYEGIRLMQAAAVLTNRDTVSREDIAVFEHVLWSDPEDHRTAYDIVLEYAGEVAKKVSQFRAEFEEAMVTLNNLEAEAAARTPGEPNPPDLMDQVGEAANLLKLLKPRVESYVANAEAEGHPTVELEAILDDIKKAGELPRKIIGIG